MKIAVWILSDYKHHIGGGFALYDKFIHLLDNYNFSPCIEVCFVGHQSGSNYKFKKKYIQLDFFASVAASTSSRGKNSLRLFSGFQKLLARFSHHIGFLYKREIKILNAHDIDLIFYPVQGLRKIPNFPFVVSNWDIGHKASFAFPELGMNYSFDYREKWYGKGIFKALLVFAESETGKNELVTYTGLNPERIRILPLFPGGVVDLNVGVETRMSKLNQFNLVPENFFFYPAQFWAHKNHYNLLKAFRIIADEFPEIKLVFTGSDKGNKQYIQKITKELGLTSQVLFTGFIDNETMVAFYSHAIAMVMPSFLGPTNMPLLEARLLSCPVLCSNLPGHQEMMKEGALYFEPSEPTQMANVMKGIMDKNLRSNLLINASKTILNTPFSSENVMKQLDDSLIKLIPIRSCWGKSNEIF